MPHISRLEVSGFKSIELLELDLSPLHVIVGANGAGKSSLLSLFQLLNAIGLGRLQDYVETNGGARALLHYGPQETQRAEIYVAIDGPHSTVSYQCKIGAEGANGLMFEFELARYETTQPFESGGTVMGMQNRESVMLGDLEINHMRLLTSPRVYHFEDAAAMAGLVLRRPDDGEYLREDGSNLAPFLLRLKMDFADHYGRIVDAIRSIAPFFEDFDLNPTASSGDAVVLNWRERHSPFLFSPRQLPDGTRRAIALIALLLQPEHLMPGVILLDEPELGLHPYAIDVVAQLLRSCSAHRQVIVTTQSAMLANCFGAAEILVATRDGRATEVGRLEPDALRDWLAEYSLGRHYS
jgi:predicted ATPase